MQGISKSKPGYRESKSEGIVSMLLYISIF